MSIRLSITVYGRDDKPFRGKLAAMRTVLLAPIVLLAAACGPALAQDDEAAQRSDWWPGTSSVLEEERFPPAFRGTWGMDADACSDLDRPDRITIHPQGIDAWESGERLRQITTAGDRTVRVRLDVEGESLFDEAEYLLRISGDRERLFIQWTADAPEQMWVRCDR
jgi:hypothetical protein